MPSATAVGLGKFNHNCRSSSSAYFLASLMMKWRPFCTASSSNDLTATIVVSCSVAIKLYCCFDLSVLVFILHGLETSSTELPRHVEYRCLSSGVISSILHDDLSFPLGQSVRCLLSAKFIIIIIIITVSQILRILC